MANVDVILKEKVEGLGSESDIVKVKRGFARNYLLPKGLAMESTTSNLRHLEKLNQKKAEREAKELQEANNIISKLKKLRLSLELSIGEGGKAFGSITSNDIINLIKEKGKIDLDKNQLQLDKPIKTIGSFDIPIKIHSDLKSSVTIRVKAQDSGKD